MKEDSTTPKESELFIVLAAPDDVVEISFDYTCSEILSKGFLDKFIIDAESQHDCYFIGVIDGSLMFRKNHQQQSVSFSV